MPVKRPIVTEAAPVATPAAVPVKVPEASKEIWAFANPAIKEMSKSVYAFPKAHKLKGAVNYQKWRHALVIQFTAVGLGNFLNNPIIADSASLANQATVLLLLKNSYSAKTIYTIT